MNRVISVIKYGFISNLLRQVQSLLHDLREGAPNRHSPLGTSAAKSPDPKSVAVGGGLVAKHPTPSFGKKLGGTPKRISIIGRLLQ